jgi:hypothetical protein
LREIEGMPPQVSACLDAEGAHLDRRSWADTVKLRDAESGDKVLRLVR